MQKLSRTFCLHYLLLAFCMINSCTSISDSTQLKRRLQPDGDNFLIVDHLNDNEKETRFKWKHLMGKETTLDMDDDERYANR